MACTRAEKGLYLSDSEGRNFDHTIRYVSRFVLDIDRPYVVYDTEIPDSLIKETKEYVRRLSRKLTPEGTDLPFEEGMRVKHVVFGEGTVERIDTEEEKAVFVRFDKMATVRGIALRAADKLTPLGKKE